MGTITISRAEYDAKEAQIAELKSQNEWLMEQLRLLRKKQFGTSSEQTKEQLDGQLSLFVQRDGGLCCPGGVRKGHSGWLPTPGRSPAA